MENEFNEKIIVHLNNEVNVELNANNPNVQELINKLVENRDTINADDIAIDYQGDLNFDKDGFSNMLKKIIKKYLEALKLDLDTFNKIINESKTIF